MIEIIKNFGRDVDMLFCREDKISKQEEMIGSVGLRALGFLAEAVAIATSISAVVAFAASGVLSATMAITAIILAVVAHECLVIGNNMSRKLSKSRPDLLEEGVPGVWARVGQAADEVGHKVASNTPYALKNTWIAEPLYKLIKG